MPFLFSFNHRPRPMSSRHWDADLNIDSFTCRPWFPHLTRHLSPSCTQANIESLQSYCQNSNSSADLAINYCRQIATRYRWLSRGTAMHFVNHNINLPVATACSLSTIAGLFFNTKTVENISPVIHS